jgi:hypothetical protein
MSSRHAEHCGEYSGGCLRRDPAIASVAVRLAVSGSDRSRQHSLVNLDAGGTVVSVTGDRCFCAHSVDICVEARQVVVPQARTPYRESADNCDVRAADLQEKMAEQRFSVPSASTKTAATQRTSQRAERAIEHSDVRAADLSKRARAQRAPAASCVQERMTEQRFSVPSASTKTAATQRTSQRAERAIEHSEFLLRASGLSTDARRAAECE